MAWFKKKDNISDIEEKSAKLFVEWKKSRKDIEKKIKLNHLTLDDIEIYKNSCQEFKDYLIKNEKQLLEKKFMSKKKLNGTINDLQSQIDWCFKQIKFSKEIREVGTK